MEEEKKDGIETLQDEIKSNLDQPIDEGIANIMMEERQQEAKAKISQNAVNKLNKSTKTFTQITVLGSND